MVCHKGNVLEKCKTLVMVETNYGKKELLNQGSGRVSLCWWESTYGDVQWKLSKQVQNSLVESKLWDEGWVFVNIDELGIEKDSRRIGKVLGNQN